MDMNRAWIPRCPWPPPRYGPWCAASPDHCSSVVYDLSAATLLPVFESEKMFQMKELRTLVKEDGSIEESSTGFAVNWALGWQPGGLQRWQELVVSTICAAGVD